VPRENLPKRVESAVNPNYLGSTLCAAMKVQRSQAWQKEIVTAPPTPQTLVGDRRYRADPQKLAES